MKLFTYLYLLLRRRLGSSDTGCSRRCPPSLPHIPASSSVPTSLRLDILQSCPTASNDTTANTVGVAQGNDISKVRLRAASPAQEYIQRLGGLLPEPLPTVVQVPIVRGGPTPTWRPTFAPSCRRRPQQARDRADQRTLRDGGVCRRCPRTGPSPADDAESNNSGPGRPRWRPGHRPSVATVRDRFDSSTAASRRSDAANET